MKQKKNQTKTFRQIDNDKKHGKKSYRLREIEQQESTKLIKEYNGTQKI